MKFVVVFLCVLLHACTLNKSDAAKTRTFECNSKCEGECETHCKIGIEQEESGLGSTIDRP